MAAKKWTKSYGALGKRNEIPTSEIQLKIQRKAYSLEVQVPRSQRSVQKLMRLEKAVGQI